MLYWQIMGGYYHIVNIEFQIISGGAALSQPCLTCEMIEMGNAMALGDGTCDGCGKRVI